MFRMFALDPEAITRSWAVFNAVAGRFSTDRGRLIADYPNGVGRSWAAIVRDLVVRLDEEGLIDQNARKKIIEKLISLKPAIKPCAASFEIGRSWMKNAEAAHADHPWRCLITDDADCELPIAFHPDEWDEDREPFRVRQSLIVDRTGEAVVEALESLLLVSSRIDIVDPHFLKQASLDAINAWCEIVSALIGYASRGPVPLREARIHAQLPPGMASAQFRTRAQRFLAPKLPRGLRATIMLWDDGSDPNDLHPRYVLTDVGGVGVERGLDARAGGQTDLYRLDREHWLARLDDYTPGRTRFRLEATLQIEGTGGNR